MKRTSDTNHRRACLERWSARRNRTQGAAGYRDEWYRQQCLFCQFFDPLASALGEDFGACTNAKSPFDGRVMYEHDGCDFYEEDKDATE